MRLRFIQEIKLPREISADLKAFEARARRGAMAALKHEGVRADQYLSVVWADRERVRRLNRRFRDKNRFTDVIAFRYETNTKDFFLPSFSTDAVRQSGAMPSGKEPFGDLYISVAQARFNAKKFHVTLREELLRLVVHGTLHLLGYTDYVPREKKKMWAVQERILKKIL